MSTIQAQAESGSSEPAKLSPERLVEFFRRALLIRRVEEAAAQMTGVEVPGVGHYYFGQEVTAVGACGALEDGDWLYTTHRNRGHVLARGADVVRVLAELMGKANGYGKGKGGNLHVTAPELNIPLASAMLGGNMPVAVGTAMAAKFDATGRVVLDFLGDGTPTEGIFYETINLAVLWQAPVVFLCENNSAFPYDLRRSGLVMTDLCEHVATFTIRTEVVDGNDVEAVWRVVSEGVARARKESSPTFIEARIHRAPLNQSTKAGLPWAPLDLGLAHPAADSPAVAAWSAVDALPKLARQLVASGVLTQPALLTLDAAVRAEVRRAVDLARSAPFPPVERALEDVYA